MSESSSGHLALSLAAGVAASLFAGCADGGFPDATNYSGELIDFRDELILRVNVKEASIVEYTVVSTDDIGSMATCFLHARQLKDWRANHSVGIKCSPENSGVVERLSLEAGKYLIAAECLPQYADVCHVSVTVKVRS